MARYQSDSQLWVETPEVREGAVARVAMQAAVDGEYSFSVPDELAGRVEPGKRVLVPFGRNRKPQPAFCVSMAREPWTSTLKACVDVLDDERLLTDDLIELGRWISRYYFCPLGRTLSAMVPEAIRRQSGFRKLRIVRWRGEAEQPVSAKRQAVMTLLRARPEGVELSELRTSAGVGAALITGMVKEGQLEIETRYEATAPTNRDQPTEEPTFELNAEQRQAIDRIAQASLEAKFRAILLFGVSGSGKTEVYIHAIRSVLAQGKQAIFLVPEIALTTQLVDRLACRFEDVAVVHSGLTGVQRSLTWAAIARGQKRVVIGTRSAVFAPCPNLGLIVVDEEQEGSYKNLQSPRFHTRDVAIKRAQLASIPIVLGSATPSLETWYNCERWSHFERITLPRRIANLSMPAVEFVDMREEQKERPGMHLLSRRMEQCIGETLAQNQQAILLLNRRGYSSYLMCARCKTPVVCPNCQASMVFHQTTGKAICHFCNSKMIVPKRCGDASCGGTLIRFGMGTQRVEEELKEKFSSARIARADSDALTRVSHYEDVVHQFAARELDILIGTQMIAKGLDFPSVSFVGVVNADTSLSVPDFRAAERTFQLLTQVAGRAGRAGTGGRVVVQSLGLLRSRVMEFAMHHDYEGFATHELRIRTAFQWPPKSRIARVLVAHAAESQARDTAANLAEAIQQHITQHGLPAEVLGPQSAPMPRMRQQYRYDLLIRSPDAGRLMETLDRLRHDGVLTPNSKNTLVDMDPVSLL